MKHIILILIAVSMSFVSCNKEEKTGKTKRFKKSKKKTQLMGVNKIAELIRENSLEPEYKGKTALQVFEGSVKEGIIRPKMTKDNWGTSLRVNGTADSPCVISAGPDKKFSSEDDIKSETCK